MGDKDLSINYGITAVSDVLTKTGGRANAEALPAKQIRRPLERGVRFREPVQESLRATTLNQRPRLFVGKSQFLEALDRLFEKLQCLR